MAVKCSAPAGSLCGGAPSQCESPPPRRPQGPSFTCGRCAPGWSWCTAHAYPQRMVVEDQSHIRIHREWLIEDQSRISVLLHVSFISSGNIYLLSLFSESPGPGCRGACEGVPGMSSLSWGQLRNVERTELTTPQTWAELSIVLSFFCELRTSLWEQWKKTRIVATICSWLLPQSPSLFSQWAGTVLQSYPSCPHSVQLHGTD